MAPSKKLTVISVGDIMLGDGIQQIRRGVRAAWSEKDSAVLLKDLQPVLSTAQLVIGNLECNLGDVDPKNPFGMIYTGSPQHLRGLKSTGFTHLALANNHILERGRDSAEQTRQLVEMEGMLSCCGHNPVRSVCDGMTVDIFTYNLIHDTPHLDFYRDTVSSQDLDAIRESNADAKIVIIHWGDEYSHYPSPDQIELGHKLVDNGATLVLGHHPHVVQGVENYKDGVIAYSLGNFIFDMIWSERTRSAFIIKAWIVPGGRTRFEKIQCRLDDRFVPRLAPASPQGELLDKNVLRFQGKSQTYRNYSKRCLNTSRLQALFHLFCHAFSVDFKTWEALFGRRLRRL